MSLLRDASVDIEARGALGSLDVRSRPRLVDQLKESAKRLL